MTQQTGSDQRTSTDGGASDEDGRTSHPANRRVTKLRGGLEKAVTGREAQIKAQALSWAEQLDKRSQGRHHNKLHLALMAVEFIVDRASRARAGGADSPGASRGAPREAPENLGEFRNLSDQERAARA